MKIIDLHTHSNASDGSLTPEALMIRAASLNLSAIALTDHDTIAGIKAAAIAAESLALKFIPGIELSAYYKDREIHIVGLFIDVENNAFQQQIYSISHAREIRNLEMIEVMQKHGIGITPEIFFAEEGTGILTRANFAGYLLKHGVVSSYQEAFDRYLEKGKPFYIPRKRLTPEAAIEAIHTAGGIAVLAHPLLYKFNEQELDACVSYVKNLGIQAMEVYYSRNHGTVTIRMKTLAKKYGLAYSGGSDFHGECKPDIELGIGTGNLRVPYEILDRLIDIHNYRIATTLLD